MVLLAITPSGLKDALRIAEGGKTAIWCGADAISDEDYANLKRNHVSRFIYRLAGQGQDVLAGAIDTIEEHHPNQIV
jgi:hypothetical protein